MRCSACGTLVSSYGVPDGRAAVHDDETDFYGKQYWLDHLNQDFGYPDFYTRARSDLTERNLHWLKTLLKYCLPPASILELGCGPGSFVGLLQQSGYRASGVEMSPWVVAFGKETFGVPISVGPVESLDISKGSLDAIALMDVLEHLTDPIATLSHCMDLLTPNGVLLIQTPEFREDMCHEALLAEKDPFLQQLKANEHLYLFSQDSVTRFLNQIGAHHVKFEPAIFSHYDMFLVASKSPLQQYAFSKAEEALLKTPSGRFVIALLELRNKELELLEKISNLNQHLENLTEKFKEADADRIARLEQVEKLTLWLKESNQSLSTPEAT
ncbi:MAG: class I SAM-dependent methyltransferase [Bacteroidota bacterium]